MWLTLIWFHSFCKILVWYYYDFTVFGEGKQLCFRIVVLRILAYQNCIKIRDENKWHISKFWYSKWVSFEPTLEVNVLRNALTQLLEK